MDWGENACACVCWSCPSLRALIFFGKIEKRRLKNPVTKVVKFVAIRENHAKVFG